MRGMKRKKFAVPNYPKPYANKRRRMMPKSRGGALVKNGGVKVSTGRNISKRAKAQKRWKLKVRQAITETDQTHTLLEIGGVTNITTLGGGGTAFDQAVYLNGTNNKFDLRIGDTNSTSAGLRRYIDELKLKTVIGQATPNSATTNVRGIYENIDRTHLYVTSAQATVGFTNLSTEKNIIIDIYECVKRKKNDVAADYAASAWTAAINANQAPDQPVPNTAQVWTRPLQTDAGNTPYLSIGFGNYWRIVKKTSLIVAAGQKANYTYSLGKHRVNFDPTTNSMGYVKDLIIVCNSSNNEDALAATNLATVEWNKSYTFKWRNGPMIHGQSICGLYKYV